MILWDTSVWIAAWRGRRFANLDADALESVVTCGPVLQELLQGIRPAVRAALSERLFALPRVCESVGIETFRAAGGIYQQGLDRGFTIRSSMDCLIAAIAIESGVELWHLDRDYEAIAGFTPLRQRRLGVDR